MSTFSHAIEICLCGGFVPAPLTGEHVMCPDCGADLHVEGNMEDGFIPFANIEEDTIQERRAKGIRVVRDEPDIEGFMLQEDYDNFINFISGNNIIE